MNSYKTNADLVWTVGKLLPQVYSGGCDEIHALLESVGELCGSSISKLRAQNDGVGCALKNGRIEKPAGLLESYKLLTDAGFCGTTVSEAHGGPGLPYVVSIAMYELIARADASVMVVLGLTGGVAETIEFFGSPELKKSVLPKLLSGEYSGAMCLTEPNAGSDLSKLTTIAEETPSGVRLSGEKIFISNCDADVHVVLARDAGSDKQSMYAVLKNDRVRVARLDEKCGLHASPTGTIVYDACPAQLLGEKGRGLSHMFRLMGLARLGVAAQAVGVAQEANALAVAYASERKQFGKPIKDLPGLKPVLERMEIDLKASRALLYDAAKDLDLYQKNQNDAFKNGMRRKIFLSKLFATEQGYAVVDDAVQVFGGAGYVKEQGVEQLLRDARVFRIYEGTSQIQEQMFVQSLFKSGIRSLITGYLRALRLPVDKLARKINGMQRAFYKTAIHLAARNNADLVQYCAHPLACMAADAQIAKIFYAQGEQRRELAEQFINHTLPRFHANQEQAYCMMKRKF